MLRLLKRNSVGLTKLSQRATFPLRSANDLKKLDLKITVDNKRIYVSMRSNLLFVIIIHKQINFAIFADKRNEKSAQPNLIIKINKKDYDGGSYFRS